MNSTPEGKAPIERKDLKAMINAGATMPKKTYQEADRKKGGRPTLSPEEKTSKNRLTIYLTDAELLTLETAAIELGMKPQSFMKMAAFKFIKGN